MVLVLLSFFGEMSELFSSDSPSQASVYSAGWCLVRCPPGFDPPLL